MVIFNELLQCKSSLHFFNINGSIFAYKTFEVLTQSGNNIVSFEQPGTDPGLLMFFL